MMKQFLLVGWSYLRDTQVGPLFAALMKVVRKGKMNSFVLVIILKNILEILWSQFF